MSQTLVWNRLKIGLELSFVNFKIVHVWKLTKLPLRIKNGIHDNNQIVNYYLGNYPLLMTDVSFVSFSVTFWKSKFSTHPLAKYFQSLFQSYFLGILSQNTFSKSIQKNFRFPWRIPDLFKNCRFLSQLFMTLRDFWINFW